MAASAWSVFHTAKRRMGQTTSGFNLGGAIMRMSLHQTAASANLSANGVSIFTSIGSKSSGGADNVNGQTLGAVTWVSSAAGVYRFDCSNEVYSPVTSVLSAVRYAVIRMSVGAVTSGYPLCYAALSTVEFDVGASSTLTVQMATTGIFTLT